MSINSPRVRVRGDVESGSVAMKHCLSFLDGASIVGRVGAECGLAPPTWHTIRCREMCDARVCNSTSAYLTRSLFCARALPGRTQQRGNQTKHLLWRNTLGVSGAGPLRLGAKTVEPTSPQRSGLAVQPSTGICASRRRVVSGHSRMKTKRPWHGQLPRPVPRQTARITQGNMGSCSPASRCARCSCTHARLQRCSAQPFGSRPAGLREHLATALPQPNRLDQLGRGAPLLEQESLRRMRATALRVIDQLEVGDALVRTIAKALRHNNGPCLQPPSSGR